MPGLQSRLHPCGATSGFGRLVFARQKASERTEQVGLLPRAVHRGLEGTHELCAEYRDAPLGS